MLMRKDIIGPILRNERKKQGKTIQGVSMELGISPSTISSMDRGLSNVSDEMYKEYAKSLGRAEDLLGLVSEATKRKKEKMKELLHIEDVLTGNPKSILKQINQIEEVNVFPELKVFSTFLKGRTYFELRQWEKSRECLLKTIEGLYDCPSLEQSNLHTICLNDLGRMYFYDGEYEKALENTEQAIQLFDDNGERFYIKPLLYLNKVIYLEKLGREEEACLSLEYLHTQIESFKTNSYLVVQIYERYANLLAKLGTPIKALEYAKQGLQIAWENRQYRRLFSLWVIIGNIYFTLDNPKEAETRYRKALNLTSHVADNPHLIGKTHLEYALILNKLGATNEAEKQLLNALEYVNEVKDISVQLNIYLELGHLQLSQNRKKQAKETFKNTEDILSIEGNDTFSVDTYLNICDFYERIGEIQEYKFYKDLIHQKLREGLR
jgi:tetratricopeptide (TPR) repeat protein